MLSVSPIPPPHGQGELGRQAPQDLPITLPAILGRGPLLRCSNTMVSRRHAALDWADEEDGVAIEALSSQPTYVEVGGVRSKLQTGQRASLVHGDSFGFLPNAAWYRINLPGTARQPDSVPESTDASRNGTAQDSGVEMQCESACGGVASTATDGGGSLAAGVHLQASGSTTFARNGATCEQQGAARPTDEKESDSGATLTSAEDLDSTAHVARSGDDSASQQEGHGAAPTAIASSDTAAAATSSRRRTLPSWMNRPFAASRSPDEQQPGASAGASASKKKNTTQKRAQAKAAPAKRKGVQLSSSEHEDDETLSSPVKYDEASSPDRRKNTRFETSSRRALHQLSESDNEDSCVTSGEMSSPVGKLTIAAPAASQHSDASQASSGHPAAGAAAQCSRLGGQDGTSSALQVDRSVQRGSGATNVGQAAGAEQAAEAEQDAAATSRAADRTTQPPQKALTGAPARGQSGRKSCRYGASCYRRNPRHKRDEAHPGDPDYASEPDTGGSDDDDDDDRPECEYGVDCYRKNPDHRRQYRHTRVPQPPRRVKRKRVAVLPDSDADSDSELLEELDLTPLESSDDYAPSHSSDSDSERFPSQSLDAEEASDLRRMGREAKKFKRGR